MGGKFKNLCSPFRNNGLTAARYWQKISNYTALFLCLPVGSASQSVMFSLINGMKGSSIIANGVFFLSFSPPLYVVGFVVDAAEFYLSFTSSAWTSICINRLLDDGAIKSPLQHQLINVSIKQVAPLPSAYAQSLSSSSSNSSARRSISMYNTVSSFRRPIKSNEASLPAYSVVFRLAL
jgi:hypothetical protein